jgi:hypothetical protein
MPPATIVPQSIVVELPYSEFLSRTPGAFSDDYQFNLNSIFDPNRTGTGHQPLGHDQWAGFYNRYRVLRVRVLADFMNNDAAYGYAAIFPSNDLTTPTFLEYAEQPLVKTGAWSYPTGGHPIITLGAQWNLWNVVGLTRAQYTGDGTQYSAAFGSSPNETIVVHCYAVRADGTNLSYVLRVQMHYVVELFDRKQLTNS